MPISIQCTECDKHLKVPDATAGKKVRCPACKAVVVVPQNDDELTQLLDEETAIIETAKPRTRKSADVPAAKKKRKDAEDDDSDETEDDDEDDERPRRKKRPSRRRDDDDDDDSYPLKRRRRQESHRAVIILLAAGAAMLFFWFPLMCWGLAATAERMAAYDIQKMDAGKMDDSG